MTCPMVYNKYISILLLMLAAIFNWGCNEVDILPDPISLPAEASVRTIQDIPMNIGHIYFNPENPGKVQLIPILNPDGTLRENRTRAFADWVTATVGEDLRSIEISAQANTGKKRSIKLMVDYNTKFQVIKIVQAGK